MASFASPQLYNALIANTESELARIFQNHLPQLDLKHPCHLSSNPMEMSNVVAAIRISHLINHPNVPQKISPSKTATPKHNNIKALTSSVSSSSLFSSCPLPTTVCCSCCGSGSFTFLLTASTTTCGCGCSCWDGFCCCCCC